MSDLIASNTFNTTLAASASISGPYVDTSVNTAVRIWANADEAMNIYIIYADNSAGDNSLSELYHVYKSHTTAINSTVKKDFASTQVTNPSSTASVPNVNVKTKHTTRDPHPVLTYMTDDIVAQANFNLDEFDISFDFSTSSIKVYGTATDGSVHPIRTDPGGYLDIRGSVSANILVDNDEITLINPLIIGGEGQDGAATTIATDLSGRLNTVLFVGDTSASSANPVYTTSTATLNQGGAALSATNGIYANMMVQNGVIKSTNPVPSEIYHGGSVVSTSNQFPVTIGGGGMSAELIVDGAAVDYFNPLPVTVSASSISAEIILGDDGLGVSDNNPLPMVTVSQDVIYSWNLPAQSGTNYLEAIERLNSLHITNSSGGMMFFGVSATSFAGVDMGMIMSQGVTATSTRDLNWQPGLLIDGSIGFHSGSTFDLSGTTDGYLNVTAIYSPRPEGI